MIGGEDGAVGGEIVALYVGKVTGGPVELRDEVNLIAGAGIEGDRYAEPERRLARRRSGKGLALTLIEQEGIEAVRLEHGIDLDPSTTRRNLVTSGIDLKVLVGQDFRIGKALVRGVALNPPCSRLEKLAAVPGLRRAMTGRGGIRADILEGGTVRRGDIILPAGKGGGRRRG